jgi:hypothetical protein
MKKLYLYKLSVDAPEIALADSPEDLRQLLDDAGLEFCEIQYLAEIPAGESLLLNRTPRIELMGKLTNLAQVTQSPHLQ